MGESDRYPEYRLPKKQSFKNFTQGPMPSLITTIVVGFLLLLFIQVSFLFADKTFEDFYRTIINSLALPANFSEFLHKPWTILTYSISEVGKEYWRLISNCIWIYMWGSIFAIYGEQQKLIPVFLYGAVLSAIFFMCAGSLIPSMQVYAKNIQLLGANTGIMAIATAITALHPTHRFFEQIRGGIPIWVLWIVYFLINIASVGGFVNPFAIALAGAALAGFLFVQLLKNGTDLSRSIINGYHNFNNLFSPTAPPKPVANKIFYKTGNRKPFEKSPVITQERVDIILDKISQKGYQSLTKEEKDILQKAARNT